MVSRLDKAGAPASDPERPRPGILRGCGGAPNMTDPKAPTATTRSFGNDWRSRRATPKIVPVVLTATTRQSIVASSPARISSPLP